MQSRERVLTAMRRREPDRAPFDFGHGFSPAILAEFRKRTGEKSPEDYFGTDTRTVGIGPTRVVNNYAAYHPNRPPGFWVDEWGIGHQPTASSAAEHSHLDGFLYPMQGLETARQARDYPLPDLTADYRYAHLPDEAARLHNDGLAVIGSLECTVFEIAWYLRSMDRLFTDFIENPEFAEILLDRITALREVQAIRYTCAGVDIIRLGDDIGTQRGMLMSMPMWRTWLKPRLKRVIDAARAARPDILIFYHSDGNMAAAIPDLIEIGVDILNPVQPECMDPVDLKRRFGDRLSFWGTIGTQSTLPFGTPEDVRREVLERIGTVGAGGGLLLAPTHMIEPDVPWKNLIALVEAIRDDSSYGGAR